MTEAVKRKLHWYVLDMRIRNHDDIGKLIGAQGQSIRQGEVLGKESILITAVQTRIGESQMLPSMMG